MPDERAEHADPVELGLQREGRWSIAAGVVIALGTAVFTVAYRVGTGVGFPPEVTLLIFAGCAVAVVTGLRERFGRSLRQTLRQILDNQAKILNVSSVIPEMQTELAKINQAIAKIPSYAEGFEHGVQVARRMDASSSD